MAAFGHWPSFHDAWLRELRRLSEGSGAIDLLLHGWESTEEVDDRGYFRTVKHHVVRFRFDDISDEMLDELRPDNVLFALGFSPAVEPDGRFTVILDSAMGSDCGGHFRARLGEVLAVIPCDADGRA